MLLPLMVLPVIDNDGVAAALNIAAMLPEEDRFVFAEKVLLLMMIAPGATVELPTYTPYSTPVVAVVLLPEMRLLLNVIEVGAALL